MAVAYFMAHAGQSFSRFQNGGKSAVLFCFIFLYLVFAGPGAAAVDNLRASGTRSHAAGGLAEIAVPRPSPAHSGRGGSPGLDVSFQQVVHPVLREEAGVAKQQHSLGGPDEHP